MSSIGDEVQFLSGNECTGNQGWEDIFKFFILIIGFGSMPSDSPMSVCYAVNGVTCSCLFTKSQALLDVVHNWINDYFGNARSVRLTEQANQNSRQ